MNSKPTIRSSYDVVVVGVRVAGASVAMLLARAGLRVLAVDRSACGSDTTSTHAIMRAGIMQLHRWGLLDRVIATGAPRIRRTTFHYGNEAIEIPIKARDGVDALFAPRRNVLDAMLAGAASESGVHVVHDALVDNVIRDGSGVVCGVEVVDSAGVKRRIAARIVIGADGARSGVARAVGAGVLRDANRPSAVIYGYRRGLELNGTHWYFGRNVAAGAIPTNDGAACVFASMPPARYRAERESGLSNLFDRVLAEANPELARSVGRAEAASKLHPYAGRPGFVRQSWGPGWALVGDAGTFKDPLTAHGMTDALRDAELLAQAVLAGTDAAMAGYQTARDGFAVEFLDLSDEIGSFDWDLERVKSLHHQLSKLMASECDLIRMFDTPTPPDAYLRRVTLSERVSDGVEARRK